MPFFRPASRALSHFLRHEPGYHLSSPASLFSRHSPLAPFTRAFDHPFFSSPLYTVYEVREDDNNNSNNNNNHVKAEQKKPEEAKAAEPQQQQQQQQRQQSSESRLAHRHEDSHRQRWLDRRANRRHRHTHSHHPLSLFSPFDSLLASSPFFAQSSFQPLEISLDLYSTPTAYQVQAAIPGVRKEDIKLTVEDGVLTIEAERREVRGRPAKSSSNSAPAASTTRSDSADSSSTSTPASATPAEAPQAEQKTVEVEVKADGADTKPVAESKAQEPQQHEEEDEEEVSVHHVESHYGRVQRSLALPEDVNVDGLTARYEDGVLNIELPRVEEKKQQIKQINIQ